MWNKKSLFISWTHTLEVVFPEHYVIININNMFLDEKIEQMKKESIYLDKSFWYCKVRFPEALQERNSPCHRTQGLDWCSSLFVISHRQHTI